MNISWFRIGILLVLLSLGASPAAEPLRVFIRAGAKSHGPGQHDHPRFLKDWTQLLNDLERLTPANLQIVTIKPQIAGKGILIEIVANGRSSQDNIQFVSNLESSGKFYEVSPLHEEISKNPAFVGREIAVQVKYKGQS